MALKWRFDGDKASMARSSSYPEAFGVAVVTLMLCSAVSLMLRFASANSFVRYGLDERLLTVVMADRKSERVLRAVSRSYDAWTDAELCDVLALLKDGI